VYEPALPGSQWPSCKRPWKPSGPTSPEFGPVQSWDKEDVMSLKQE